MAFINNQELLGSFYQSCSRTVKLLEEKTNTPSGKVGEYLDKLVRAQGLIKEITKVQVEFVAIGLYRENQDFEKHRAEVQESHKVIFDLKMKKPWERLSRSTNDQIAEWAIEVLIEGSELIEEAEKWLKEVQQ